MARCVAITNTLDIRRGTLFVVIFFVIRYGRGGRRRGEVGLSLQLLLPTDGCRSSLAW